jgi:hypothetical protein
MNGSATQFLASSPEQHPIGSRNGDGCRKTKNAKIPNKNPLGSQIPPRLYRGYGGVSFYFI